MSVSITTSRIHLPTNITYRTAMPAVTSGKALVTGANGFVAMWLVRKLLERGFSVRGTVRSESKIAQLKQAFADFGEKFEGVIVEDITKVCVAPADSASTHSAHIRRVHSMKLSKAST